ncbi:hypothetical protein Acsp01_91620 [Actinoplanes sp. NBRC 101535]|nr:hypothetical protein Acsp01_91620 [Actinoplanes sp. NBRC 101535]
MPRHPPFALDNLTTKNKMLASTVQFSTNDQPTTHTEHHQTPPYRAIGMGFQVMPGIEDQPQGLFFQIPNRVLITGTPAAPALFHAPRRKLY